VRLTKWGGCLLKKAWVLAVGLLLMPAIFPPVVPHNLIRANWLVV
jgi:hypothetical protein